MTYYFKQAAAAAFLMISSLMTSAREHIDLAGDWNFILLNAPSEIPAEGKLSLPGTLDTNRVGIPVEESDNTSQLSRRFSYTGSAIFSKTVTIPEEWRGKHIELLLERTLPASVAVDGKRISYSSLISAPQRHGLSDALPP